MIKEKKEFRVIKGIAAIGFKRGSIILNTVTIPVISSSVFSNLFNFAILLLIKLIALFLKLVAIVTVCASLT